MINRKLLHSCVIREGMTLEEFARNCLNIDPATLFLKLSGKTEFKHSEMLTCRDSLNLKDEEFNAIFFAE